MLMIVAPLLAWQAYAPDAECESQTNILRVADTPARQGATIDIYPKRYNDMSERDLSDKCIDRWELSDPTAVALSPDHRSLIISQNAIPGTIVSVSYVAAGRRETIALRIVGRNEPSLTGAWAQTGMAWCGGRPLGELRFTSDGGFSATFHPFESYIDYSGTYRWDPETAALVLVVKIGGNETALQGLAKINGQGVLQITGISFENMTEKKGCENLFK